MLRFFTLAIPLLLLFAGSSSAQERSNTRERHADLLNSGHDIQIFDQNLDPRQPENLTETEEVILELHRLAADPIGKTPMVMLFTVEADLLDGVVPDVMSHGLLRAAVRCGLHGLNLMVAEDPDQPRDQWREPTAAELLSKKVDGHHSTTRPTTTLDVGSDVGVIITEIGLTPRKWFAWIAGLGVGLTALFLGYKVVGQWFELRKLRRSLHAIRRKVEDAGGGE